MIGGLPDKAVFLVIGVFFIAKNGLMVSAFAYVCFNISQKINRIMGNAPMREDLFKVYFDEFMDFLLNPIGKRISTIQTSPKGTTIIYQIVLGFVVLVCIVLLQVISMVAVTGVALAGYHYLGMSFNLFSALNGIAAGCVFLAIVLMSHGNQIIRERTAWA